MVRDLDGRYRMDHAITKNQKKILGEFRIYIPVDVDAIISQIEIYDRVWYVRHMPHEGEHSREAISLVKEFVARLEEIPDGDRI